MKIFDNELLDAPFQERTLHEDLILGFRFGVLFLAGGGVPNLLDIRFQKVTGLSTKVNTTTVSEGGQNLYAHRLPKSIEYENLVLERGMVVGSPLNLEFNAAMSLFKFYPSNVIVMLFNEKKIPVSGWLFIDAYPVKWATSDLYETQKSVVIDTIELAYKRMQILRI